MSADHKVPFFFFAAVAVACSLVLANSVQEDGRAPGPRQVAASESSSASPVTRASWSDPPDIPAAMPEQYRHDLHGPGGMGGSPGIPPVEGTPPPQIRAAGGELDPGTDTLLARLAMGVPGFDGRVDAPGDDTGPETGDDDSVAVRPDGQDDDGDGGQTAEPEDPGTPSDPPSEPHSDPTESADPIDGGDPSANASSDPTGGSSSAGSDADD